MVVPPPPTHNTLNYNRLSISLISLLFWVRVNPNPDTVAELTLTCRGGAVAVPIQHAKLPLSPRLSSPPGSSVSPATPSCCPLTSSTLPSAQQPTPLPACPFVCQLACPPSPSASSVDPSPLSGGRDRDAHTTPRWSPDHGQPRAPPSHSPL